MSYSPSHWLIIRVCNALILKVDLMSMSSHCLWVFAYCHIDCMHYT